MESIPSTSTMLNTIEHVVHDVGFDICTYQANKLTLKNGVKLENVLAIVPRDNDKFVAYVTIVPNEIHLIIWNCETYNIKNDFVYKYYDFTYFEGLVSALIISFYDTLEARYYI